MITKTRFSMMTATVLMVFMLSAMWTVPAFADDSTPPPVETPTEVVPPVDEETAVEAPVAEPEAPVAEPEAPADEPVVVVDESAPAADESAPAEEVVLTDVLEQLPEGTQVQVVDENGENLPMASQEAADAVAASDPIWCPSSVVTPVSGGAGCSPSQTSFNDLLTWLTANNPGQAGTIWIEKTYDSGTAPGTITDVGDTSFTLDGLVLNNMSNFALTIRGGWNGIGTNTIDTTDPSEFNASLSIINWLGAVTISDILIDGASVNPNTGGGFEESALLVDTAGAIQLNRVTVKNSAGAGAMNGATLDNTDGAAAASTVAVNNGVFENNEGDGLHIYSAGVVTITSLIADGNDEGGALIDNTAAIADRAVTLNGAQEFSNNGNGAGLIVYSNGFVTISNVIANLNAGDGVAIDNSSSLTNQGVSVLGTNMFNDNANGLSILSHGVITTYNIFASENGADGVNLDNCDGSATSCGVAGAPGVFVNGNNYFFNNGALTGGDGLDILSYGQIVTYNLTASGNADNGVLLDNHVTNAVGTESISTITLNGYNVFNNNTLDGLNASSNNDIIAYNLNANENLGNGVSLTANRTTPYSYKVKVKVKGKFVWKTYTKSVAHVTVYGANNFVGNSLDGLNISSNGAIGLYSVNATYNLDDGADLTATTLGYGVALYNTNYFTDNVGTGLVVHSTGAVTLNNINANFNDVSGADITATGNGYAVTLNGSNYFTENDDTGLFVSSAGAVTVYNVTARSNLGNGVEINNRDSLSNLGVSLLGTNVFTDNAIGLRVLSHGAITTYNLYASENTSDGVQLDNCDVVATECNVAGAPGVVLNGTNYFYNNTGDGLDVLSFGAITTYNLNAVHNDGNGALLDNQRFNTALTAVESYGAITMNGTNNFNNNGLDGLHAYSNYNIAVYNITANENSDDGAELNANRTTPYTYSVRVKVGKKYVYKYYTVNEVSITLLGTNIFNNNLSGDGLAATADGAITVYNLTANGNGHTGGANDQIGNGATLDNCMSIDLFVTCSNTVPYPVTVYGFVNVSDNDNRGLEINSLGAVTLSNIIATGNTYVGVRINNKLNPSINPATVRGVTITGTNIFNNNDSTGLYVLSYGAITLNNINAYYNGDSTPGSTSGVVLDNAFNRDPLGPEGAIIAKNITMTGVNSFVGNYYWGLEFNSNGIVSLSRISANGNDYGAADAFDGGGVKGIARSITLTCGHMYGNGVVDPGVGYNLQVGLLSAGTAPALSGVLTLNGIYSGGNGAPDATNLLSGSTAVVTPACALP